MKMTDEGVCEHLFVLLGLQNLKSGVLDFDLKAKT